MTGVNQPNLDYIAFERGLKDAFAADRPTLIGMCEDAASPR